MKGEKVTSTFPLDSELTSFAIEARHQIQHALHDLYRCSDCLPPLHSKIPYHDVFHLLVGSGFALWRAAFLADFKDRDPKKAVPVARHFLEAILTSNIVTFGDEKKAEDWSGGYYINNAALRLEWLARLCPKATTSREFRHFLGNWPEMFSWSSTVRSWAVLFLAYRTALDWLMKESAVKAKRSRDVASFAHAAQQRVPADALALRARVPSAAPRPRRG